VNLVPYVIFMTTVFIYAEFCFLLNTHWYRYAMKVTQPLASLLVGATKQQDVIIQQNSNRPQTTSVTQNFLANNIINVLEWLTLFLKAWSVWNIYEINSKDMYTLLQIHSPTEEVSYASILFCDTTLSIKHNKTTYLHIVLVLLHRFSLTNRQFFYSVLSLF